MTFKDEKTYVQKSFLFLTYCLILTSFSVLTKDQVIWVESSRTTNMCPLFTIVCHVEGNAALKQKQRNILYLCHGHTRNCKRKNIPVSVTHKEYGPLCSAESSSDKSLKRSLWRAEQEETQVSLCQ